MEAIFYGLVLLAPISLALTLLAHVSAFFLLSPRCARRAGPTPPITVLKPVKGLEEGLYENLASIARQDYPDYEILVGAEDALDPALDIARRVQADHPGARIRIRAGSRRLGLNPKVNLLAALAERAEHDHLLVSDSNVRVGPRYLRETAAELADSRVGLVTNALVGEGSDRIGGVLESLQLNSFVVAGASLVRAVCGRVCVIGKSMLFRRTDLDRLGGFWAVRNVLAEDYLIGRRFERAGYRVALSPHLVTTVNGGWTLQQFANRHLRWAQMRRRLSLPAYLGELLLNPVLWIALSLGTLAMERRIEVRLVSLGLSAIALKCISDVLLWLRLRGELPPLAHAALIPVKDLLMAGLWLLGAFRRTVNWRGTLLRIETGSTLVPLEPQPLEEAVQEVPG